MLTSNDTAASAERPRVLVLLASCNGERWIEQQIGSVLAQTEVDLQLQISDDNSTDGTMDIVRRLAASDRRIKWTEHSPGSGSAAANFIRMFREARHERFTHVALCDQDDVWPQTKLATACVRLAATGADLYSAATLAFWPDGRTSLLRQCDAQTGSDFLFEGAGQGCTFVITARLFGLVQQFVRTQADVVEGIGYHDWLVYALSRAWGARWVYDGRPQLQYRQHGQNDTGARASTSGVARRLALIRSGWYSDQVRRMLRVSFAASPDAIELDRVSRLMSSARTSLLARASWASYLLRRSRRRFSDRLILCACACFGYLS